MANKNEGNSFLVTPSLKPISYSSVDRRSKITVNGQEIIEMTTPIFDPQKDIKYDPNIIRITSQFEGRPTLVAKALTGSEDDADIILHYNYISNPFSVCAKHIFVAPNIADANKAIASGSKLSGRNKPDVNENLSQKELNKNLNVKDKKRILELMKQSNPNLAAELKNKQNSNGGNNVVGDGITQEGGNSNDSNNNNQSQGSGSNSGNNNNNNQSQGSSNNPQDYLGGIVNDKGINVITGKPATLDDLVAGIDFIKTPNMACSDQWKAIDGKIIFGANISSRRCSGEITSTQGKSELIRNTVRNMIRKNEI